MENIEKQCLHGINKKKQIFQIIQELGKKKISLLSFKDYYSPIELSTQLSHLTNCGIASVDWNTQELIMINYSDEKLIANRNSFQSKRITPTSMKTKKIEINKPTLNFKRED